MLPYTATDVLYVIKVEHGFDREARASTATPENVTPPATARSRGGPRARMRSVFTFAF